MPVLAAAIVACLTAWIGLSRDDAGDSRHPGAAWEIPVFPGAALETRLPAQGEARYFSFRSHADPAQIRRFFIAGGDLDGWRFTGLVAGSAGVILQDMNGRRLIIDVKETAFCLLRCSQQIDYWMTAN